MERITNLVLALLDTTRPLSLREIGASVAGYPAEPGALRQAFERDKRTLRDGGIPIAVERLDNDDQVGYRILPEEYYLPDLGLDLDEQRALSFALAAIHLEGATGNELSVKLGLDPIGDPPLAILPALPSLAELHDAISSRAAVRFSYRARARLVEPYGLAFKDGSWYLLGRDLSSEDGGLRRFRVDRIEGDVALEAAGSFEPPTDLDLGAALSFDLFGGRDPSERDGARGVVLDVDVREVPHVASVLGEQALHARNADGSARFSCLVADEEGFISFVLGLGDLAVVVEPEDLRARVIARLERVVEAGHDR